MPKTKPQEMLSDNAVVISLSGMQLSFLFLVQFRVNVKRSQRASLHEIQATLPCRKKTEKYF